MLVYSVHVMYILPHVENWEYLHKVFRSGLLPLGMNWS